MRYEFTCDTSQSGRCRVCDTKWLMSCEFEHHRFNDTLEITDYGQLPSDPQKVATAMRELGDWLSTHHYSEIFPEPVYELKLSDDDSELHIIRHKEPFMDAVFHTDDMAKISDALKKASEFVRKRILK
ncbi:MAG: hypothetical protein ACI4TU_09995 [Candidatus Cryptobacteroides sp.]